MHNVRHNDTEISSPTRCMYQMYVQPTHCVHEAGALRELQSNAAVNRNYMAASTIHYFTSSRANPGKDTSKSHTHARSVILYTAGRELYASMLES